jgi:transposase
MTLFPQAIGPIPEETARIARAANPKGTLAMWLRDALGAIYTDEDFADLYPERGQPALAPWRLAVVTLLQYAEDLTDRQAAEAVRARLDWKYLLGLDLSDPGFDASVLVEFRQRLLDQGAEQRLLDKLLQVCRERGWLKAGGKMRTDSTHVLAAVRSLHHLETVGETLRAVLEDLAEVAPDWLVSWLPEAWFKRYEGRMDSRRLPKQEAERRRLAEQIGRDGVHLLRALEQAETPAAARELESVQVLRQVWPQYYEERERQVYWRDGPAQGAEVSIVSPYDTDARLAQKRDTAWCGYKVHLTETCEPDLPELVVLVKTRLAPRPDVKDTLGVQQELEQRQLLPQEHLLDGGYLESEVLVKHPAGLRIVGPVPPDTRLPSPGRPRL